MNAKITPENATKFSHTSEINAMIVTASRSCNCQPYEDIFTYNRWQAQGYQVRKGEHGTKIETYAPVTKKNENNELEVVGKRPWISTVFCRCQVDKKNEVKTKTSDKVKATHFKLHRAEGRTEECVTIEATTWKDADNILRRWAVTAPDEGHGYDKCDFTITYADGETYTGRYDLKKHDQTFPELLAFHIRGFQTFYAGTNPAWMDATKYAAFLKDNYSQEAADFIAKYEIGE